jgi:hypothetical protein
MSSVTHDGVSRGGERLFSRDLCGSAPNHGRENPVRNRASWVAHGWQPGPIGEPAGDFCCVARDWLGLGTAWMRVRW